jgi:uncharacterized protein YbjT (DUF2867 family)
VILVTGGTGTLGRQLVAVLVARGEQVRVLTRDPARADGLAAEVVVGDLRTPATLPDAVRGCAVVVAAAHGLVGDRRTNPATVDRDGNENLVRAAVDAGVQHLVLLSGLGAAPDHPMELLRMKHAAEQTVRESGLAWTIVRPAAYLETWQGIVGRKLVSGGPALVFGPGTNPINFVSVVDVAAVVDQVIAGSSSPGQVIEVGGPENITLTELAERLVAAAAGRQRIKHVPLPMLRAMSVLARPVAPGFARQTRMALWMNSADLRFDGGDFDRRFPEIARRRAD